MQTLVQIVDSAVADAYRRGGRHLLCHQGCAECCIGVFPISQQDAARLRQGLADLEHTDPSRAEGIRQRVTASIDRLSPHFPGDATTGILFDDVEHSAAFEEFANDEPCPVLNPDGGACDLYEHRPVLCRTFGPPARTADGHLAHCELCFSEATTVQIRAAELDPSLEQSIADNEGQYNETHRAHGETLVAYALRGE